MTGLSFVADTNFLIHVHEGNAVVEPFLDTIPVVSVITEIELLGWTGIPVSEDKKLRSLLSDCVVMSLNTEIKDIAIRLRQQYKIKTPDAIVVSTAMFLQLPLITSDKGFEKLTDLLPIILI